MIDTLKTSALITLLFAALMTVVFLAAPSYAGPSVEQSPVGVHGNQI